MSFHIMLNYNSCSSGVIKRKYVLKYIYTKMGTKCLIKKKETPILLKGSICCMTKLIFIANGMLPNLD